MLLASISTPSTQKCELCEGQQSTTIRPQGLAVFNHFKINDNKFYLFYYLFYLLYFRNLSATEK